MNQDPHITQTIRRIAEYKIRGRIISILSVFQPKQDQSQDSMIRQIFLYFVKKELILDIELEQVIKIIHTFYETEANVLYPELSQEERRMLSKNHTKNIVKDIIKEELKNRQSKKNQGSHQPISKEMKEEAFKQQLISPKRNFLELETDIKTVEEKERENNLECIRKIVDIKIIAEDQYRQSSSKLQHTSRAITINIPKKSKQNSFLPTVKLEDSNIDPLNDTHTFGHFLYGDKIQSIQNIFSLYSSLFATISWRQREDGFQPLTCAISVQCVRDFSPLVLASYYKQFLSVMQSKCELEKQQQFSAPIQKGIS